MKDNYVEAFKHEAFEILEILEASLIDLETNPDDEELIGKIFRSLHTLKGSGGMFGFEGVASFVHSIETVYDRIRKNKLKATNDIIDLTLRARDQILIMIKNDERGPLVESKVVKEILSFFSKYSEAKEIDSNNETGFIQSDKKKNIIKKNYYIVFDPADDLFFRGTKPTGLLNELCELGEAIILPLSDKIPLLNEIDPEKLYTSWEINLYTEKDISTIKDVFIFVEDDCRIEIKEVAHRKLTHNAVFNPSLLSRNPGESENDLQTGIRINSGKTNLKKILLLLHQKLETLQIEARLLLES